MSTSWCPGRLGISNPAGQRSHAGHFSASILELTWKRIPSGKHPHWRNCKYCKILALLCRLSGCLWVLDKELLRSSDFISSFCGPSLGVFDCRPWKPSTVVNHSVTTNTVFVKLTKSSFCSETVSHFLCSIVTGSKQSLCWLCVSVLVYELSMKTR